MTKRQVSRNTGVSARLMKYFEEHPGSTVHIDDLVAAVPGATAGTVQSSIAFIKSRKAFPVEVVISGQAYRYMPNKAQPQASAKRVFEEIGTAREGIVIQDEAGKLYLAKEL